MASLQFRDPKEVSDENRVVWRSLAHAIQLFNEAHHAQAKSLSPRVKTYLKEEGKKLGWNAVFFPLEYPSKTKFAGVVFFKKKTT